MQRQPRFSALLICLSSLLLSASARADLTITDTFQLGTPGRQVQGLLNTTKTETGNATWSAVPQMLFAGDSNDGWVVPGILQGSALVSLPADAGWAQIDLDVKVASDTTGWVALGFTTAGNPVGSTFPGGMFLYLDNNGYSQIRANGLAIKVATKTIPDFQPNGLNHLQLTYDKVSNTVSALVNKTTVASNLVVPGFVPGIAFGGFSDFSLNLNSKIDNFSIDVVGGNSTTVPLPPKPTDVYRILFIGDSITQSLPNPALGWTLTAGMAASAGNLDYVSLVTDAIGKARPNLKVEKNVFGAYGGKVGSYTGRASEYRSFQPDLVVLQFGENETGTPAEFQAVYETLLQDVSGLDQKPAIVCVGIWSPGNNAYAGRWGDMTGVVQNLAAKYHAGYAPVDQYAADPACRGVGATSGVQWHPNDAGHRGYADEILAAWNKLGADLLAYALGGSPFPSAVVSSGNRLALTFQRNPALTDINYTVEASSDLSGAWTPIARSVAGGATTNLGGAFSVSETGSPNATVTVEDLQLLNSTPKRFLRLNVVRP